MKYKIVFVVVFGMLIFANCNNRSQKVVPIVSKTKVEEIKKKEHISVNIKRYEKALTSLDKENLSQGLQNLQKDYYFFIGDNPQEPQNVQQIKNYLNDPIIKQLYNAVQQKYPDLSDLEEQFADAFALLKYHFPNAKIPQIYTAITGLYFEAPIVCYDTTLVISLDLYLGKDYQLYKRLGGDVPKYILRRFAKEYILPNCFGELSYQYINVKNSRSTMLEEMMLEGKSLLFMEMMLPNLPDSLLYPYPSENINWAKDNEASIWAYVIENNYLYSKDANLIRKFVGTAPFTAAFGRKSPGAVGKWLGWQICRSWVQKNPDKNIQELLQETDAQKILTASKYKPKR